MSVNIGSLNNKVAIEGTEKIPVSGAGNPSITPNLIRTYLTPYVTPEQLGAVGDGSTNDVTAIQNAVNTGLPVFFGSKNYRVNSTITLPSSAKLMGNGEASIISTTSNISIITIAGKKCSISDITLLGNDVGGAQIGINVTGNAGLTLDYTSNTLYNVRFRDLNFAGLYVTLVVGTTGSLHQGAIYAENCIAESCTNGFYFDNRGEYCSLSNCVSYACATGVRILAGNVGFYGGQIVDGTTGVVFATGSNDGKCVFAGTRINHNAVAVSSSTVTLGSRFIGCQMIANGSVTCSASASHEFIGCQIGNATLTITNSPTTKFINCRFQTATTLTITGTTPKFFGCTWDTGVPASIVNTLEGGLSVDTTVTAGGATGAQVINKISGTVNFAPGATTLVVTNSLVSINSIVPCVVRSNDTTAIIKNVVPGAGLFTITLSAAATAETSVGFFVIN